MSFADQTFSPENYKLIWDQERRRGRQMSSFAPELAVHSAAIRRMRQELRASLGPDTLGDQNRSEIIAAHREKERDALAAKRDALKTALQALSLKAAERIETGEFHLGLVAVGVRNKKMAYKVSREAPCDFFLIKQIERNLADAFKLAMTDRHLMVTQINVLLADHSPKSVLKADLLGFFESVPHTLLLERLESCRHLSRTSLRFVRQLLADYEALSGVDRGLPRGVGLSSFLAEIYLQDVDQAIRQMAGVTYYSRYVDDIVVVSNHKSHDKAVDKVRQQLGILLRAKGLSINTSKTRAFSSNDQAGYRLLRLLGYEFKLCLREGTVELDMSKRRFARYVERIEATFNRYANSAPGDAGASSALVSRVRMLTGNHKAPGQRGDTLMGVSASNRALVGSSPRLRKLDEVLAGKIAAAVLPAEVEARLDGLSFSDGFTETRFERFPRKRLTQMKVIWKYAAQAE